MKWKMFSIRNSCRVVGSRGNDVTLTVVVEKKKDDRFVFSAFTDETPVPFQMRDFILGKDMNDAVKNAMSKASTAFFMRQNKK